MLTRQNAFLLLLALVISLMPLAVGTEFTGTDNQAVDMIGQLRPDYEQWFDNFFKPSPETEKLLFRLQAALGAGFIGYFVYRKSHRAS